MMKALHDQANEPARGAGDAAMSYYRLIERRRAATRPEPDVVQRAFGVLLYAILIGLTIWIAP